MFDEFIFPTFKQCLVACEVGVWVGALYGL